MSNRAPAPQPPIFNLGAYSPAEIKEAVEILFNVKVADVRTQNRRGKLRRYRLKVGRMRNWKKAIVALHEDYRIDFY